MNLWVPCSLRTRGAFHYAKDSGNFGWNSNGKVRFRDHLWRWSTYFGWNIPTEIRRSFLTNRFFALIREEEKQTVARAIPIGWPGLIGKCRSILLGNSH